MKVISRIAAAASAAALLLSCQVQEQHILVHNPSDFDRMGETVELDFDNLLSSVKNLSAENAVVVDASGAQVASQIYTESDGHSVLLFQPSLQAGASMTYTVKPGEREDFPIVAYSRHVPERLDDYAYENDLVAGRIYGPALSDPRTFGCDVWLKCTSRLILDEWFQKMDYHHNYGDGMDCYKVANTLGGGAVAPYSGESICLGDNWATQTHICDGPIRTKAAFTFNDIELDGRKIKVTKEISLDAGSRFVKSTTWFNAEDGADVPVVVGAVLHEVISREDGQNWIAFTEVASDTKQPEIDGNISIALVLSPEMTAESTTTMQSHAVITSTAKSGQGVTAWTGSGWSQGGIESPEAWARQVERFAACVATPLEVTLVK